MDLRHMRHFVAVAEELHFGRAAQRLNMAQPPLSQSIQRLEGDLGVTLFNRSRREVQLTDAGRVYLAEARRTLMQADLAARMARRAAEAVVEVRVSFVGPALYRIVPALLVAFREQHPDVHVRLFEQASPQQIGGILRGDYDIGFVTGATEHLDRCDSMPIERSGFVAAVPANWAIAQQPSITIEELVEHPFIRPPERVIPSGPETLSMFHGQGLVPNVAQEAAQTNTTLSLVGVGVGCSVVMATAQLAQPRNVKMIPILPASPKRWEMVMAWPFGDLAPATQAFLDVARTQSARNPHWMDSVIPVAP